MKSSCTELGSILGITFHPLSFTGRLRLGLPNIRDGSHPDMFKLTGSSYQGIGSFNGTIPETIQRHLHIRLSGTKPNFTNQNVLQRSLFAIVYNNFMFLVTCLWSSNQHNPVSFCIRNAIISKVVPRGCNRNFPIGSSFSPQFHLSVLL